MPLQPSRFKAAAAAAAPVATAFRLKQPLLPQSKPTGSVSSHAEWAIEARIQAETAWLISSLGGKGGGGSGVVSAAAEGSRPSGHAR